MSEEHLLKQEYDDDDDDESPLRKKIKVVTAWNKHEKLEDRLNNILSCTVCLDLPSCACMQCCHGHLMCIGCYHHLLADARLKDEQPTCPSCRVEIGRGLCTRNLAVEKTISELPVQCGSCSETFPRSCIRFHRINECSERTIPCKFHAFGCDWAGRAHELDSHLNKCQHPRKSPEELLTCLDVISKKQHRKVCSLQHVISLLSCEHISYMEVQLRPHRTDDFVTKLFYESNRFHMMGHSWLVKAFVSAAEEHPSNPTISSDRKLTYQLILKTKISDPLEIDCMLLRAPYEDVQLQATPHHTKFSSEVSESQTYPLEVDDINRLLGSKVINLRLFLFQHK